MVKGSDTTVSVTRVQAGDVYVRVSSIGMVTGDDDLIAEGKTEHGEAMQRAHARAEGEHEAEDGAKDAAGAGEPA